MKLNRRFYDASINFRNISKAKWLVALIIGLASAFFMYSFFYIIRETFRVMSVGFANYPSYVTESNRRIYNLFFAGLSVIYGNSIALSYLLSRSQNVFSRRNLKRSRVFNDQIFLNGNFAHWFLKIILVMGAFSMGMMDFDYLPFFYPVGALMLLVFYLETWKTLLQVLGKKRYRWLLMHFLTLCLLTYSFSFINITDYKVVDAASLEWKPIIDIPESKFITIENQRRDLYIDFKLRLKGGNLEIIDQEGKRHRLEDLPETIQMHRVSMREELMDYLTVSIIADKNLPMHYILEFQNVVCSTNVSKFVYVVNDGSFFETRFQSKGIAVRGCVPYIRCGEFYLDERLFTPEYEWYYDGMLKRMKSSYDSNTKLEIIIGKEIKVNDLIVPDDMLVRTFKNNINNHTNFIYNYTLETSYKDYIKVLSAHFEAVYSIRKDNQTVKYEVYIDEYDADKEIAFRKEQDSLKNIYPIAKIESIKY